MFFEDHNPPHFHVEYHDYEALVEIESGLVKGEFPRRALKLVYEWLDLNKNKLLENWNNIQNNGEFNKIEPLK